MILAGAVGNVIDSTFYGVFLNNAPYGSPTPWFHGQVIDMIFVDIWEGFIPEWVPVWGGQYYSTPIFNIADSCIFIGVCLILFFQRRFFSELPVEETLLPSSGPDATQAQVIPTTQEDETGPIQLAQHNPSETEQPEQGEPHPAPESIVSSAPKRSEEV
jgi:signal peptidase II